MIIARNICDIAPSICELSELDVLCVTGSDAEKFLQSQLTSDVNKLDNLSWQRSCWCSPEGRVLSIIRLIRHTRTHYWLIVPSIESTKIANRLTRFVLRANVKITTLNANDYRVIGTIGQEIFESLPQLATTSSDDFISSGAGLFWLTESSRPKRAIAIGPNKTVHTVFEELTKIAVQTNYDSWAHADILAGVPEIKGELVEQFLPQMLNLDLTGSIDFEKGCYPGQEIIARTKYLGRIKRRTMRVYSKSKLKPSDTITSHESKVGTVLVSVPNERHVHVGLAVVSLAALSLGDLRVRGNKIDTEYIVDE